MLAANLEIVDAYLVDGNFSPVTSPVLGERVAVWVDYQATDLAVDAEYLIDFSVDGVTLDSGSLNTGAGGNNGNYSRWRSGWYALSGTHTVDILLDSSGQIAESNENDNQMSFNFTPVSGSPPAKFIWPVEGEPFTEIGVTNYVDLNPLAGISDWNGSNASYDGHSALDAGPGGFYEMDEGVDIYAAADGVVISVHDGEFDRQTSWVTPAPSANYVIIDHGQGWETIYWHLRRDSVQVEPGQVVQSGDRLGFMGSSGISDGVHIHFGVRHHGRPVEPFLDPETYFVDPLPYVGDAPAVFLSGVTNYNPTAHLGERPSDVTEWKQQSNQLVYAWARFSGLREDDVLEYIWRRPNGTTFLTTSRTISQDYANSWWWWSRFLPSNPDVGTWTIDFQVNGNKIGEQTFDVTATGAPEIRMEQIAGDIVLDNRYTPLDFGNVPLNAGGPTKTFVVVNHGDEVLNLGSLSAPVGFQIAEGLPAQLAPGASDSFNVQMNTDVSGYFAGQVKLLNDDADEGEYNFSVEGVVDGPATDVLTMGIGERMVTEGQRTIANVRRNGSTNGPLVVNLSAVSNSEVTMPAALTIPAGQSSATFWIDAVDDLIADGDQDVSVVAQAAGYADAMNMLRVVDKGVPPHVLDRYVFYNNSFYDTPSPGNPGATNDDAIAPDKSPLLPGQAASFANYTSYSKGINGVIVDLSGSLVPALNTNDFAFRIGRGVDLADWSPAPLPNALDTTDLGNGVSRVTITWPDNAIADAWLEVRVFANENTGLITDDVFYFGNVRGESGDRSSLNTFVNAWDFAAARGHQQASGAAIDNPYDYDRDDAVNATDAMIARDNTTNFVTALSLLSIPSLASAEWIRTTGYAASLIPRSDVAATTFDASSPLVLLTDSATSRIDFAWEDARRKPIDRPTIKSERDYQLAAFVDESLLDILIADRVLQRQVKLSNVGASQ